MDTSINFVSLYSESPLKYNTLDQCAILSDSGEESYPVIDNIPVIVENPQDFLADSYALYGKHLINQQKLLQEFSVTFKNRPLRLSIFENLRIAIEHNSKIVQTLVTTIEERFSKEQLLQSMVLRNQNPVDYLKAFRYLKRDWCGFPESEEQLSIINENLKTAFAFLEDRENALVLGAGLGRIACDLRDSFSRIYAMDKSWSMAYLFQLLFRENILFYEINYNNIVRNIHVTRLNRAGFSYTGMSSADIASIREKLVYFVSDVRKMPLAEESMSSVLSVYFTDVIALEPYLSEVHRVLKMDGIFIHFGPLGYQFNALEAMLTAEEIKAYFFKLGYEPLIDKMVETKHLASHESLYNAVVNNWFFVTRKKQPAFTRQAEGISADSIPEIVSGISYVIDGNINVLGQTEKFTISTSNGRLYDGSKGILDFIAQIDGNRSVAQILQVLQGSYDLTDEDKTELHNLLKRLVKDGVVQIKSKK